MPSSAAAVPHEAATRPRQPLRALFVCPDMRTGGAERHWAILVPALRRHGVEARVLCLAEEGGLYDELVEAGVPAACVHMRGRLDPRGLRRALAFAAPAPDVVVTRGVSAQLVGEALARRFRAPHLMNEHTPLTATGDLLPLRPHQHALTRLVAPLVARVVAVTDRQIEPLAGRGYRRRRIEVVPNGVFADSIQPRRERDDVRAELGVAADESLALCVARLQPEKRVDVFVTAAAAARRGQPRLRPFVAGDGDQRAAIEQLARGTGVELLGVRADVHDLMAAADVVCLTSDSEALPMSLLEAMALGRPVLATDVGGTRDQLADGAAGLLVPTGDVDAVAQALTAVVTEPERIRTLGERGRERQRQRFDGEAMVEGYLRVLRELGARS